MSEEFKDIDVSEEISKLQGEKEVDSGNTSQVEKNQDSIWKSDRRKQDVVKKVPEKKAYANKPEHTSSAVLTIDPDDNLKIIDSEEELWHELKTAFHNGRSLRNTIDEVSRTPNGHGIVVTYYKNQRIIIPLKEMGLQLSTDAKFTEDEDTRLFKLASNMLGAEIDFVIKSVDKKEGLVLASRKAAILDKIKTYYAELDENRVSKVANTPDVQARILSVGQKNIRVDVFGIQTQINAKDIFYEWVVDLGKMFSAGDYILVHVSEIDYPEPFEGCENDEKWLMGIKIKANHKKFEKDWTRIAFENHQVGSKTRGTITDYNNGVYFITLKNKVNAIAHSVSGRRTPMVGDVVSYVCKRKDAESNTSVGLITKVISSEF